MKITVSYVSRASILTRQMRQAKSIQNKTKYDWDMIDEIRGARHRIRDKFLIHDYDPLEIYCSQDENKSAPECRVYDT